MISMTLAARHVEMETAASVEAIRAQVLPEATILGRRVLMHQRGHWVGSPCPMGHLVLGQAAQALEDAGLGWQNLTTAEEVVAQAEALRSRAIAPLLARGLPASWLVGIDGRILGTDGLAAVETAIELAEALDEDWKSWPSSRTVQDVLEHELPRLHATLRAMHEPAPQPPTPVVGMILSPAPARLFDEPASVTAEKKLGRKAARRAAAQAKAVLKAKPATHLTVVAKPAEPTQAPVVETPRHVPFLQGKVYDLPMQGPDGRTLKDEGGTAILAAHVVCTGRGCWKMTPVDEARVAKSIASLGRILRTTSTEQITREALMPISFCRTCADKLLPTGHQSVAEAVELCVNLRIDAQFDADRNGRKLAGALGLEGVMLRRAKKPVRINADEYKALGKAEPLLRLAGVDGKAVASLDPRQRTVRGVLAMINRRLARNTR